MNEIICFWDLLQNNPQWVGGVRDETRLVTIDSC